MGEWTKKAKEEKLTRDLWEAGINAQTVNYVPPMKNKNVKVLWDQLVDMGGGAAARALASIKKDSPVLADELVAKGLIDLLLLESNGGSLNKKLSRRKKSTRRKSTRRKSLKRRKFRHWA